MNTAHHTTAVPRGPTHLAFPKGFLAVRVLQILCGLIVLGLTASLLATTNGFSFDAEALTMFTTIAALIIAIYAIIAEKRFGHDQNNLFALLALEIFIVIFWLASMADLASLRSAFSVYYFYKLRKRVTYYATNGYLNVLTADVVVSAVNLILWAVSLFFVARAFHAYRVTHLGGGGSHATTTATGPTAGHQLTAVDPEKHAGTHHNTTVAAPYQQQPAQPVYQQQPVQPTYQQQPAQPMYQQQQSAQPAHHHQQQQFVHQAQPLNQGPPTGYSSPAATLAAPYDAQNPNHSSIGGAPSVATGSVSPVHSSAPEAVAHQYTAPPAGVSEVSGHTTGHTGVAGSTV